MRILHTSDWHVGKRLGRYDRLADHAAVLDEIAAVADDEKADLVVVSGDLFDRPAPPVDALRLVLGALERLARRRPVVAIAGNHDSPALFDLLAPLLAPRGVHLVGGIKPPRDGGVLELEAGGERVLVACLPYLREGRAVDFMQDVDGWYRAYAERLELLIRTYAGHLERHGDGAVTLLVAHLLVRGVRFGAGGGDPTPPPARGERPLLLGEAYAVSAEPLGGGPSYAALGHVHTPQEVAGAGAPARYAGSPLELDFGEAGEPKQVVLVDAVPGAPARCRPRRLTAGRRLLRARGRFDELAARPELAEAFLDLEVETDGPDPGLADRARAAFPYLVKVRAVYRHEPRPRRPRRDAAWDRLYVDYCRRAYGSDPDPALLAAFRQLLDDVLHAPA
ncbi:MAG: exonuclease SbcCD subunit D [Acidobacteria bacterium]|nr:MAG: exonuclease SbcCD subunit D [Acidobacteriota bacterium]